MTQRVLTKEKGYRMNRYMVELKKKINSKKTFCIYVRALSVSQVVEMLNDDYVIVECVRS